MAKKGLEISNIQAVLKDVESSLGWSLCIGAGTSSPVLPNWFSLAESLIRKNCEAKDIIEIDTYKNMGFSADAMIQAVRNHLNVTDEEFIYMLSDEIYTPIKDKISDKEWKAFVKIHEVKNVSEIKDNEWECFKNIIDTKLSKTSANLLAKVISKSITKKIAPKSILTFNGEAIFLSLLNYYCWKERSDNKNKFDRVVNSITNTKTSRIPYIHCHGVLPINDTKVKKGHNGVDKLVFLEESYLQLANSPVSWQSINFIENCMNSKMVFIGVSLTDANMRRWLGWIHSNKLQEFKNNDIAVKDSTEHFWINKRPCTDAEKTWIEESVAHLGVRLVWIDEWSRVGEVLKKMLGF